MRNRPANGSCLPAPADGHRQIKPERARALEKATEAE
uniref:Uncharacterized protein n=1 Tax=Arundo donax TaxID=35708 RepID=A0A0A9U0J5_ARUDO